jgi:hypothetical protein
VQLVAFKVVMTRQLSRDQLVAYQFCLLPNKEKPNKVLVGCSSGVPIVHNMSAVMMLDLGLTNGADTWRSVRRGMFFKNIAIFFVLNCTHLWTFEIHNSLNIWHLPLHLTRSGRLYS